MADIVDEFVVTLGLDPSSYKKEMAGFRDDLRKTKEETRRTTRDMESDGRRAAESFNRLKNEIVGLFLVVAGARSIGGLVVDLIHGAAETGRFGQAIGMATERVSVWEMAVQSMGGTAQDARAGLAALNAEYTSYMLTARAVHDADLAALGISANDLQSPEALALALAERRSRMTQREFTARLLRLGLPDSFIRTLAQGTRGVEDLLEQMRRLGPVTEADSRAAQEAERQWSILINKLRMELRPIITWLIETGLPFLTEHIGTISRGVTALAAGVGLLALRFLGLPGVIVAATAAMVDWNRASAAWRYFYVNQQVLALENELSGVPFIRPGNPGATTPENRANGQRRLDILTRIAELRRLQVSILESAEPVAPTVPGASSTSGAVSSPAERGASATSGAGGILARVRQRESNNNYDRVVYDIMRPPRPLTQMTMGEVFDWQRGPLRARTRGRRGPSDVGSTGTGAYQFESMTLAENARLVFGPNWRSQMYNLVNQDAVAQRLYERRGLAPWGLGGTGGRGSRPTGGAGVAARRNGAGGWGDTSVSVGSIVVYTPHGTTRQQADAVAQEIPRAVQRKGVVTQANTGLQ